MTNTTTEDSDNEICSNRSEIVFVYDGTDTILNGDPLGTSNRQRIDPVTGQAVVTDVRLKRYLREQLEDDGYMIYISNTTTEDGSFLTRSQLAERVSGVESPEDISEDFLNQFLERATDVRYFGSTMAFDTKNNDIAEAINKSLPDHLTGPVQFTPGRTLNQVRENEGYNSLTSVIASKEGKKAGGYQIDDHKIVYGLVGFSGVVNENNAGYTQLSNRDVRRLDSLCWRSIKNQANSRSKQGQHPRLYIRVEYEEGFHIGNLDRSLKMGANSKPDEELTDVYGASIEIGRLVQELSKVTDHIKRIHVNYDDRLLLEHESEPIKTSLAELLETELEVDVREIDVYAERDEMLNN